MTPRAAGRRSLPDTALGVLAEIDEILCDVLAPERKGADISLWGRARLRLLDAQPGVRSRPAGNGEPSSGRMVFTHAGARASSSVVEVETERHFDFGVGWEVQALARFDALPPALCWEVYGLAVSAGRPDFDQPVPNGLRRLVWCRYVLRHLIADGGPVSKRRMEKAHALAVELGDVVSRWSGKSEQKVTDALRLADDQSGMWCRSCLRVGTREPRNDRYPKHGLCRWCGDFHANQGFLPTPVLLEARRDGRTITVTMVDAAKPRKKRKK